MFELEKCIEEQSEYIEGKSLVERAIYVFILSPVMEVGDVDSSSNDVTLYKAIGGSAPKTCKAHFMTGHNKFKSGHTCASFLPLRML